MWLETTANQSIIAGYKARFKPDPAGKGYLFSSSDYGFGTPCSTEKYQSYVTEFEAFVNKKVRFMKLWMVFIIIMSINITILSIPFEGTAFLEHWKESFKIIGMITIIFPLLFIYKQGWGLYNKPIKELHEEIVSVKRRQNSSDIRDKRLKGMSSGIPSMGIAISIIGLYFSFTGKGYESPYMPYYFGAILLFFLVMSILKFKAHRKDDKVVEQLHFIRDTNKSRKR